MTTTNFNFDDTIAAIATAPAEAGIAIVRLSGPQTFAIADAIFRCRAPRPSDRPGQTFVYGHVYENDTILDEALMLIMRAPQSYTAEDMVEIQGHGGLICARRILRRVLGAGARLAEPGEFTKRAFLNGRLDLLQAEAVLDLVRARSDRAAQAALEQLEGRLSSQFNGIYDELIQIAADLEASLDFPEEEDVPRLVIGQLLPRLAVTQNRLHELLASWDEGRILRDGILAVISGKPNAGKSTLLNVLLGTDRAIVSPIPGTTRDTIEEDLTFDGIPLRLVDTAGLRTTECTIEQAGINRTLKYRQKADLNIYLVDAATALDPDTLSHLQKLTPATSLVILNKIDLSHKTEPQDLPPDLTVVPASLVTGEGLPAIRQAMRTKIEAGLDLSAPPHAVINERHRQILTAADRDLAEVRAILSHDDESQLIPAISLLRQALEGLGTVTGRIYHDELLNNVFSRFCIGK